MSDSVVIRACSRIHAGLLNEAGYLGRVDGGLGFALEDPAWEIEVTAGSSGVVGQPIYPEYSQALEDAIRKLTGGNGFPSFGVIVHRTIPPHAGLGAKTALLMAAGKAVSILQGRELTGHQIAGVVRRGSTSGIGVNVFQTGGVIWDAGHKYPEEKPTFAPSHYSTASPPHVIGRYALDWLEVVHFRFAEVGLHAEAEANCFRIHCPIPQDQTIELVANYVFRIVPGVLERNELALQSGLARIQELGFKDVEWSQQCEITRAFRDYWYRQQPSEALGLSSFGPTLYVLTRDPERVVRLVRDFGIRPIHLCRTRVANHGAMVTEKKHASSNDALV